MRYKASFKPSYVLGHFPPQQSRYAYLNLFELDPHCYDWHQMDSNLMQRMSNRNYLSMSIERQYNLPVEPSAFLQSDSRTSSDFGRELAMGPEAFGFLLGYLTRPDDAREPAKSFSSAFEAGTPGVMRLEEVEQEVNLGRWQLRLRGMVVFLEVRITWELEI